MVERDGGRIEVESMVNDGTVFTCYLREYAQTSTNV
jgi:signal transduction histidine kinase